MTTHGKTVAVPAIPKLFDYIHKRYAKLSLEDLINPAIELAIEGHAANWATEKYSRQQHARLTSIMKQRKSLRMKINIGVKMIGLYKPN